MQFSTKEYLDLHKEIDIQGFFDANWDGYMDHKISTRDYVFNLFGGAINWMSKRDTSISLSTTKVEYLETTQGSKEVVWLQRF
jgi:hypothetical protein